MKKSITAVAVVAVVGGLTFGGATAAFAHDAQLVASCDSITLNLANYPAGSTVDGTLDGQELGKQSFSPSYYGHVDLDGTVTHTYTVDVVSGDGNHAYDHFYRGTTPLCAVVTPPATTPPVETPPVTEPPVTTPPVETPPVVTPPVTTPPVTTPPVTTPPVETPPVETPPVTTPPVTTPPVTSPPVTTPPVTAPPTTSTGTPVATPTKTGVPVVTTHHKPPTKLDKHTLAKVETKDSDLAYTGSEHVLRNGMIGFVLLLLGGFFVRAGVLSRRRNRTN